MTLQASSARAALLSVFLVLLASTSRSVGQTVLRSNPAARIAKPVTTKTGEIANSQMIVTDPIGFMKVGGYDANGNYTGVLAQSDTCVSPPFTLPPAFIGNISSVAGRVINVSGSPGFAAGQFAPLTSLPSGYTDAAPPRYYVLFSANPSATNPKEGSFYSVIASDANTLTLDLNGDDISAIPANTQIAIIPYWTLSALFPASNANVSFVPSTSTFTHKMEILLPDLVGQGINLAPTATYYYINNGSNVGWRKVGRAPTTDSGIDPLYPETFFVIRNNTATTMNLKVAGGVLTQKFSAPVATRRGGQQDNFVTLARPVPQTLNQCGLISSGAFRASASNFNHVDELCVFDNNTPAINKSISSIYYYINSGSNIGWRKVGAPATTDFGDAVGVLQPGSAYIVRKGIGDGTTNFWTNTPNY